MKFLKLKKGAMFGLDNQKKENCHPELGSGSHEVNAKHAAMFGLDARIALAIFGALSVISGAALYSAIQSAKVVQWQVYFSELTKATEAYYLDTGKKLPFDVNLFHIEDLVVNRENLTRWNGPYWSSIEYGNRYILDSLPKSVLGMSTIIQLRKSSTWDPIVDATTAECIVDDYDCAMYFTHTNGRGGVDKLEDLFNLLDEKIDDNDGPLSGNVRLELYGGGGFFNYKSNQYTKRS